jgi:hypothetical protein
MQEAISRGHTTAGAPARTVTTISGTAAKLSFGAAIAFLVLLAALHFLKPELDPSWHMISEYSIGKHGWIMQLAFLSLTFGLFALFFAISSQVQTIGGRIGLWLLPIVAAALTAAAFFTTDPITTPQDQFTTRGNIHGFAAMIGNPGFVLAAVLISISLVRNPAWSSARRLILWTGNLPWICLVVMLAVLGITLSQAGEFGPEVLVGWPNRLLVIAYSVWIMALSWHAIQLNRQES